MAFLQVIDYHSSRNDEILALDAQWEAAAKGEATSRRTIACRDRNDPNHYIVLVFFDSYESAMENSDLPATQQFAEQMSKLVDGPPNFLDLEIVDDRPI